MTRKRKRKNTPGTFASFILLASVVMLAAGAFMAMKDSRNKPDLRDIQETARNVSVNEDVHQESYPGLETVIIPDSIPQQIKEYVGFTINFNKKNKTPNYVAWELIGNKAQGEKSRSNKFWTDPEIDGCPSKNDYTRSGYDRGHMCPSGEQKWSHEAMEDCFVMANICPQDHELNNKAWKTLENKERQWAKRDSAIMIVSGPVYSDADTKRIGNAGVRVPGAFFKVLLAPYVENPRGIAFVYPNMIAPGNMQDYAMSIDELEKIIGYDFFPSLPDDIEEKVESTYSFKEWNKSSSR